jgi:hypothetical protein
MAKQKTIEVNPITVTTPKKYVVTIQGTGGILFNKMPDLSISKTEKKAQAKEDLTEKERKVWREKLYFDKDNRLYIPGENIHESFIEGSAYWGEKVEGNKRFTDLVKSAIIAESLYLGINKDSDTIIPFGKAVNGNPSRGKKSGCKVYKIRPLLNPWGGSFIVHVFDQRISLNILKTIVTFAGTFKGLCDWRPVYGRYELVSIEEV